MAPRWTTCSSCGSQELGDEDFARIFEDHVKGQMSNEVAVAAQDHVPGP